MKRWTQVLVATLALAALSLAQSGCHSVRRGEPIVGPMDLSNASLQSGQKLFLQHCHQCHPRGEGGLGPPLNNKPAPAFLVKLQVRTGLGSMPSFHKNELSDEELNQLIDYLMALRKQDGK